MKYRPLLCILIAVAVAVVLVAGCTPPKPDPGSTTAPPAPQPPSQPAQPPAPPTPASTWPSWVPKIIPEFKYGKILTAVEDKDGGAKGGALVFYDVRLNQNPYNAYKKELLEAGWEVDEEVSSGGTSRLNVDKDSYWLTYSFASDGVGTAIYYGARSGTGGGSDPGGVAGLPKDYPSDFCPVYPGAAVFAVTQLPGLESGATQYMVGFVSKDSVSEIAKFYEALEHHDLSVPGPLGVRITLETAPPPKTPRKYAMVAVIQGVTDEGHEKAGYKTQVQLVVHVIP